MVAPGSSGWLMIAFESGRAENHPDSIASTPTNHRLWGGGVGGGNQFALGCFHRPHCTSVTPRQVTFGGWCVIYSTRARGCDYTVWIISWITASRNCSMTVRWVTLNKTAHSACKGETSTELYYWEDSRPQAGLYFREAGRPSAPAPFIAFPFFHQKFEGSTW